MYTKGNHGGVRITNQKRHLLNRMRCEISNIVESHRGFFDKSSRKPLKFIKTQKDSKSEDPQLSDHVRHLGSIIADFGEKLVRRVNYDHVCYFKHSFKIKVYLYVMVII